MKAAKLDHWLKSFGMPTAPDDLVDKKDPFHVDLTVDAAIRIIQKNERGRIGIQRAVMVANWRKESAKAAKKAPLPEEMSEKVGREEGSIIGRDELEGRPRNRNETAPRPKALHFTLHYRNATVTLP